MTTKNKISYVVFLCAVLLIAAGCVAYYTLHRPATLAGNKAIPSQAAWDAAAASSTGKTLFGTVSSVKDGSIVVFVQQPNLGTTTIAVIDSIPVIKNTPLSPDEMAAAFKEFQKEQAAAGGKPFVPPSSSKIVTLTIADLKAGDIVLITLTPNSTKESFAAQKIEVLPAQTAPAAGFGAAPAGSVPAVPKLPSSPVAPAPTTR